MTTGNSRSLKVRAQSGYMYKPTPTIILKGQWLKNLGFDIDDPIRVECEEGKLIITKNMIVGSGKMVAESCGQYIKKADKT